MKKKIYFLIYLSVIILGYTYTQNDLLEAQLNFQNSKKNLDKDTDNYNKSIKMKLEAEKAVRRANQQLNDAIRNYNNSIQSLNTSKKIYYNSQEVVNKVWDAVNNSN